MRDGKPPGHNGIHRLGGYPCEVARPEEVIESFRRHGFRLEKLVTCPGGFGNNEFLFRAPGAEIPETA